jgi:hypothetical protein
MSGCDSRQPHQFPTSRAPACAAESPKLSLPGAAPGRLANFSWGRGRKVMHLPCKQAQAGALPAVLHQPSPAAQRREKAVTSKRISAKTDLTCLASELRLGKPFRCGENQIRASLISSASAGATPAPATNFREVIRLPDCKSGVVKRSRKQRAGALPALPTSLRRLPQRAAKAAAPKHEVRRRALSSTGLWPGRPFCSRSLIEKQPVVCGKSVGASPTGSANF